MALKGRIKELYQNPPSDGRVICVDEFGSLEIRPYPGYHWVKSGEPQRFSVAYYRDQGTMTLFAALDLKEDLSDSLK